MINIDKACKVAKQAAITKLSQHGYNIKQAEQIYDNYMDRLAYNIKQGTIGNVGSIGAMTSVLPTDQMTGINPLFKDPGQPNTPNTPNMQTPPNIQQNAQPVLQQNPQPVLNQNPQQPTDMILNDSNASNDPMSAGYIEKLKGMPLATASNALATHKANQKQLTEGETTETNKTANTTTNKYEATSHQLMICKAAFILQASNYGLHPDVALPLFNNQLNKCASELLKVTG